MINNIYTIFDEKVGAYLSPFYVQNDNVAVRSIAEVLHDSSHAFARFPSDYTLYCLGTFDNATGVFTNEKRVVYTILEIKALFGLTTYQAEV